MRPLTDSFLGLRLVGAFLVSTLLGHGPRLSSEEDIGLSAANLSHWPDGLSRSGLKSTKLSVIARRHTLYFISCGMVLTFLFWGLQAMLILYVYSGHDKRNQIVHGLALSRAALRAPLYEDNLSGRFWRSIKNPCQNCRLLIDLHGGLVENFNCFGGSCGAPV